MSPVKIPPNKAPGKIKHAGLIVIYLVITTTVLVAATAAQNTKDQLAAHLRSGKQYASRGNYSAALGDLEAAVQMEPDDAEAWFQLAIVRGQIADFRGAEAALRHALKLRPHFPEAHYHLGLTLIANPQSKLDWPGAIAEFRAALKDNPDYAEARNLLGAGLTAQGETEAAILELRQAVRIKLSLADAHFNLAVALQQNGQAEEAIKEYHAAILAKGTYPQATTALGELLFSIARIPEAKEELQNALRGNPDLAGAHHALGEILQSEGQHVQARLELSVAADLAQRTADAMQAAQLSNQGLKLASQGDLPAANATLRKAILRKPDYGISHFNLALILADQGDLQGAVSELTNAISLLPGQSKPWLELGRVLRKQGRHRGALDALCWAARLAPSDETIRAEVSVAKSAKNQSSDSTAVSCEVASTPALAAYSDTLGAHLIFASNKKNDADYLGEIGELLRSVALQPDSPGARRELARAYQQLGDFDHAVIEYQKLMFLTPRDGDARATLGKLLLDGGRADEAAEQFRLALIDNPTSEALRVALRDAVSRIPERAP